MCENGSVDSLITPWECRSVSPSVCSSVCPPGSGICLFTQDLDKTLLTVNALISHDERISSNPVAKVVFGDPAAFLPQLPQNSVVHSSKMWSCRQRISVEYLRHVVEQKNGREAVPVLWKFLQKVSLAPPISRVSSDRPWRGTSDMLPQSFGFSFHFFVFFL